jgi:hypothetical protein
MLEVGGGKAIPCIRQLSLAEGIPVTPQPDKRLSAAVSFFSKRKLSVTSTFTVRDTILPFRIRHVGA